MKVAYLRYKSCTTNNLPLCCELFVTGAVKEKGKPFVVSWKIISRKQFVILPDLLVLAQVTRNAYSSNIAFSGTASVT